MSCYAHLRKISAFIKTNLVFLVFQHSMDDTKHMLARLTWFFGAMQSGTDKNN